MTRYYLTTAIDYSNGDPHLGHALEKVGADVTARYRRRSGDEVHFVIGMDEHGQKIAQEAESRGITPQELVDRMADRFREAWRRLEISHDDFIRTTEARHEEAVHELLARVRDAGDLYLDQYEGYYCVGCEAFKKEEDLDEEGRCPVHPDREISWTEEENYFFRLSDYRDDLLEHIGEHPEFIRPESRRNEILGLLEGGLDDISASRSRLPWGLPFPGAEDHTVYVWFDALPNYVSAVGFPGESFERWWPANLHVIGKDITRFHCVIWPAILMSAGLELPETVWGHGFVSVGGGKLSKSSGVSLELPGLVDRHGADAFRYFLMREVPWDGDRDFPEGGFLDVYDERYNSDLANDLGNLLNRTISMIGQYRDGQVPPDGRATELDDAAAGALAEYRDRMDEHLLHQGLEAAAGLVRRANAYVDEARPWELASDERDLESAGGEPGGAGEDGGGGPVDVSAELDAVLGSLARALAHCAAMYAPFMPSKSRELWRQLGGVGEVPSFGELEAGDFELGGTRPDEVLFPRHD